MITEDIEFTKVNKQYTMFDLYRMSDDIWYWENTISCPEDISKIIEKLDENPISYKRIPAWKPWTASDNADLVYGSKKDINILSAFQLCGQDDIDKTSLYVINSIKMAIEMCYDRYIKGKGLNHSDYYLESHTIPIKKWNVGMSMGPHCDNFDGHSNLSFSIVLYLNDDYEGGEINFPNQNIKIKPKPGSLIMFPSHQPFIHEVLPVTSGSRYMVPISVFKK